MTKAWLYRLDDSPLRWLALLAAVLALQIGPWWFPTPDSAAYLSMARSLAETGTMRRFGSPHLYFSPGYPLLISPLFLLGPRPLLAISILHWLLAVLSMVGIYRWMRANWPGAAVLLTAFVMTNTSLWLYLRRPVSEMAFMAALVWAANILDGALGRECRRPPLLRATLGSAVLAAAGAIRPAGVMFALGCAAMMMAQAWRGALRWGVALLLAGIVMVPPMLTVREVMNRDREAQTATASNKPTYFRQLLGTQGHLVRQVSQGVYLQVLNVGRLLLPGMLKAHSKRRQWGDPNLLLYGPLALAVLVGWSRRLRDKPDLLMWGLPLYVGLHVLWPFDEDTRFLLPVLPVLAGCLWTVLGRWRHGLVALALLVVAHALAATVFWVKEVPGVRACHAEWPAVEALAAAIPPEAGPVAAVGTRDCVAGMLAVARDRQVAFVAGTQVPGDAQWIVQPAAQTVPRGFESERTVGEYVVATRRGVR